MVDVVSKAQRDTLRQITGEDEKIVWIDNGVITYHFCPQPTLEARKDLNLDPKFTTIMGYAGNFPWERGGMQIVEALPELAVNYPAIGALILGSGSQMHLLYDRAKHLGVYDRSIFVGQVDYEKVPQYINAMDIGVSLRYEDTQHASELKVRQYLACGKPAIVTPGGNDFVEQEQIGFIVNPYDKDAFVKAAEKILRLDEEAYNAISYRAREYAKQNLSYRSKVEQRLKLWDYAVKKISRFSSIQVRLHLESYHISKP